MHNSFRPAGRERRDGPRPGHGYRPSDLISTPEQPFRLKTVGTWNPHDRPGTKVVSPTSPYCSAHYFDQRNEILAYAWYDQGTRFIDVRNPRHPKHVAYYRPDDGVAWAPCYHRGYIFVADPGRGVDILKLNGRARRGRGVRAPKPSARHQRLVAPSMCGLKADPQLGWRCPLLA